MADENVNDVDDLMIITRTGIAIRLAVESIRISGRATQGVRLINLQEEEQIASIARVDGRNAPDDDEDEDIVNQAENNDSDDEQNE